jgi:hypothetical protein
MKKTLLSLVTCLALLGTAKAELVINSTVPEIVPARAAFPITASVTDTQYGPRRSQVLVLIRRNGLAYQSYRFVTDQNGNGGIMIPGLPARGLTETYSVKVLVTQLIANEHTVTSANPGAFKQWSN